MAQGHKDRLSAVDASFLHQERESSHMHVGGIAIFEGPPPAREEFCEHIESRLHLVPRYRQKLSFPPVEMGRPFWIDDPRFNIDYHVRHTALPSPGSEEQLRGLAGRIFSQRLDRSKPLWEIWLAQGLEGDRFALISKTHHALVDGVSGVDIATVLFDMTAEVAEPPEAEEAWTPAPEVPLNVPIGPHRRLFWTESRLDDFKAVKNALGGTVNDVFLAVVAGGLARWLRSRGVRTEGLELRGLVPVSIRSNDQQGQLGNQIAALRGPLPVYADDPVERLEIVRKAMQDVKESKQALGAEVISGLEDFAPPTLLAMASRLNFSTRLFNVIVTNVPGPQFPLYLMGREMLQIVPVAFLPQDHALAIAAMSYNGKLDLGLLGDYDAMPDLEKVAAYFEESLAELKEAAKSASTATV